jgi:hypothetical protein
MAMRLVPASSRQNQGARDELVRFVLRAGRAPICGPAGCLLPDAFDLKTAFLPKKETHYFGVNSTSPAYTGKGDAAVRDVRAGLPVLQAAVGAREKKKNRQLKKHNPS